MNVEGRGSGGGRGGGGGGRDGIVQKPGVPTMIERETFETKKWRKERDYNS